MNLGIDFTLTPQFDIAALNIIIGKLKASMADAGKNLKLIDEKAFNKEMDEARKKFDTLLKETGTGLEETSKKVGNTAGTFNKAFQFSTMITASQQFSAALDAVTQKSIQFESDLAAVGAITGFSGEKLDKLGESARTLAMQFGGSATDQLKSFQGVLSKLGPQIAEDGDALALFGRNINLLSAASGDDAATSMEAITNAMLQLGLASGTPMEQAQNSTLVMNAMAASAKVGAAEIPQVSAAVLQAGVAAKGANMDIVSLNAGIQVLAVGGKTGAEAGVALRNVLGLLQNASGPAEEAMNKLGTSSKELGNLLTTQGLDVALSKLQNGMNGLGTDAERNATMMKIFGTENASAAGILMQNTDKYAEFSAGIKEGMEGVGSAYEQAEQRMNTSAGMIARSKAVVEDVLISLGSSLGNTFTTIASTASSFAPMVTTFAGLGTMFPTESATKFATTLASRLVPSLFIADAATKSTVLSKEAYNAATIKGMASEAGHTILVGAKTAAVGVATAAQWLWNAAISANPIGLLIAGTAALIGAVALVADAMNESAAEREESLKKESQAIDQQINSYKKQESIIQTQKNLVASYEELGSKTKRTAEEEAKFRDIQIELAKTFPTAISSTKSFGENLASLKEKTSQGSESVKQFQEQVKKLEAKKIDITLGIKQAQGTQIQQEIGDIFSSFSGAEQGAKNQMNQYLSAMKQAQSEADLAQIGTDMKMAIFSDPNFASLDGEEKQKLIKLADSYSKGISESMKLNQAKASNDIKNVVDEAIANGTEVSPTTLAKIALTTNKPIAEIEKMYSEIKAKALSAKVDEAISKSFEIKGKINGAEQVQALTDEYAKAMQRLDELKSKKSTGTLTASETAEFDTLGKKAQETADKIGAIAPASKTNFRTVIDEAGNIKTVFDINIGKAKEFADSQANMGNNSAQTQFTDALNKQAESIDAQKAKLSDLKIQIDATNDPTQKQKLIDKYNEENASIQKNRDTLIDAMVRGANAGLNIDDSVSKLAKSMNITNEEAKKLVLAKALKEASASGELTKGKIAEIAAKYKDTTGMAEELAKAQKKNTDEAKATAEAAKDIYTKYSEAEKKLKEDQEATIKKILALKKKEREEGLTEDEKAELKKYEGYAEYGKKKLLQDNKDIAETNEKYDASYKKQSSKKLENLADTLQKQKDLNTRYDNEIANAQITNADERARKDKKDALQKNVDDVSAEITALTKKGDKITAQEKQLVELKQETLNKIKKKNDIEMLDYDTKIAEKAIQERLKNEETSNKAILDAKKKQLEFVQAQEKESLTNGEYISNIEKQKDLKIAIIQETGAKEIEELFQNTEKYKQSEELRISLLAQFEARKIAIKEAFAKGATADEVAKAQSSLTALENLIKETESKINDARNEFGNTDEAKAIKIKVSTEVDDSTDGFSEKLVQARIDAETDAATRTRDIAINEARKTLDEELKLAKDNYYLQEQAHRKFNDAKAAADEEFRRKSKQLNDILFYGLSDFTKAFAQSMMDGMTNPVQEAIDKLQKSMSEANKSNKEDAKKEYDASLKDFKDSAKQKVMSSADMYDKIAAMEKAKRKREEEDSKETDKTLKKMQLGTAKGFQSLATFFQTNDKFVAGSVKTAYNSWGEFGNYTGDVAKVGVANMASMYASGMELGEAFRKGMLGTAINTAEEQILVNIGPILSTFFAWMGPWGYVAGSAAIATAYGALEFAKASIGAFRGAVDIEGPGTETSDSIPARLSKRESVLTAEATKQPTNIELFKWLNANPRPAYEYYLDEMPEVFADRKIELFPTTEYTSVMTPVIIEHDRIMEITRERILNIEEIMLVREIANNTRSMDKKLDRLDKLGMLDQLSKMDNLDLLPDLLLTAKQGNFNRKSKMELDVNVSADANSFIKEIEFQKRKAMRNG